jgi:hypothetical protein
MIRDASLRSVAVLLGHQSMKTTMRYAHMSPAFLAAEVSLLDPPPKKAKKAASPRTARVAQDRTKAKKARKRQLRSEIPNFVQDFGSPQWTISAPGWSAKRRRQVASSASSAALIPQGVRNRRRDGEALEVWRCREAPVIQR